MLRLETTKTHDIWFLIIPCDLDHIQMFGSSSWIVDPKYELSNLFPKNLHLACSLTHFHNPICLQTRLSLTSMSYNIQVTIDKQAHHFTCKDLYGR